MEINFKDINEIMGKPKKKKSYIPMKDVKKQNLLQFAIYKNIQEMINNTSGNVSPLADKSDVSMMFKHKSKAVSFHQFFLLREFQLKTFYN